MMVHACDMCKTTKPPLAGIFVVTGREATGAGDMDDTGESVDLCTACAAELLSLILYRRDYKLNKLVLNRIKGIRDHG